MRANFILYVSDQNASTRFYGEVLMLRPSLDVPGMTEFRLNAGTALGLMPVAGIRRLLGDKLRDPDDARGVPRAEIYLFVDDPQSFHMRALEHGANELSPLALRDWGDEVAYSVDRDGHVLAFARSAG
jgi:catechol 2,3-dioxygenase-like lactoylglutathione lyase family enzyme